ncbi:uncharacterized protein LOC133178862 isoform X2 [Saccostrea echinata]|uniref:uncharacterized protein LOC133178862 isoform X2 n=1 Tax=Saccostrea echinata TaxID=191078 RepID=UPI002A80EA8B|nr:uncharacterized protein LOC133178862 isoform X2 [Saccostrea echinata]
MKILLFSGSFVWLFWIFFVPYLVDSVSLDNPDSSPVTNKVSGVLRDILNRDTLVRLSMVQKIQTLAMDAIDTRNNTKNVMEMLKSVTKEFQNMKTWQRKIEEEISNFEKKLRNEFTKMCEQQNSTSQVKNNSSPTFSGGGALFVQWGKPRCPDNTSQLVYSGYLGGSEYSAKGAAVTNVCLSPDPIFGNWSIIGNVNQMYGSELEFDVAGPGTATQDNTCAVCKSKIHSTSVMIPGRNECYPEWKKQYSGYLMSSPTGFSPKDIICLNEHPEFVVGGGDNDNGNLLFPIKAVCGSLECPPYVDGKLLTCVVCTQ